MHPGLLVVAVTMAAAVMSALGSKVRAKVAGLKVAAAVEMAVAATVR